MKMKIKVGNIDLAKNYALEELEQGELVYDLRGILGVWTGNFFSQMKSGISVSNGALDDFDKLHRSGVYNVTLSTLNNPISVAASKTGFAFFIKRNLTIDDESVETIRNNFNEMQVMASVDNTIYIRSVVGVAGGTLKYGAWKTLYSPVVSLTTLDTPYYTLKMQQEGIYEDYIAYRDELHEYENSQTTDETMLLPVLQEPVVPESVKAFAEKYKLI